MKPFEEDLGYHPRGMYSFLSDTTGEMQSTTDFIEAPKSSQSIAQEYLEKARQAHAAQVNKGRPKPTLYNEKGLVMLSTKYIDPPFLKETGSRKLKAKYAGPFSVVRRISPTSYEIRLACKRTCSSSSQPRISEGLSSYSCSFLRSCCAPSGAYQEQHWRSS